MSLSKAESRGFRGIIATLYSTTHIDTLTCPPQTAYAYTKLIEGGCAVFVRYHREDKFHIFFIITLDNLCTQCYNISVKKYRIYLKGKGVHYEQSKGYQKLARDNHISCEVSEKAKM